MLKTSHRFALQCSAYTRTHRHTRFSGLKKRMDKEPRGVVYCWRGERYGTRACELLCGLISLTAYVFSDALMVDNIMCVCLYTPHTYRLTFLWTGFSSPCCSFSRAEDDPTTGSGDARETEPGSISSLHKSVRVFAYNLYVFS